MDIKALYIENITAEEIASPPLPDDCLLSFRCSIGDSSGFEYLIIHRARAGSTVVVPFSQPDIIIGKGSHTLRVRNRAATHIALARNVADVVGGEIDSEELANYDGSKIRQVIRVTHPGAFTHERLGELIDQYCKRFSQVTLHDICYNSIPEEAWDGFEIDRDRTFYV